MKHKLQYTEIGQFYTGILMYCDACTRKKYDLPPKTNTSFPKLDGAQRWSWNWDSHWNEIWKPVETNTIQHFPKLDGLSQPSSSVFGRFQTLCEEKNTQKPIQKWIQMYGRADQLFPTCLVPNKSLYLASTFSASPHRGLRHSSQCQTARSKYITNLILRRGALSRVPRSRDIFVFLGY